jgi:lysozyme family protein
MKDNFDYCLNEVLKSEGGYSNDAGDPGGPTNFGITIIDYRKYINPNGTASDVRNMHVEDAKKIYKLRYWDALNCDTLPSGVDYCVFDYGVNSGISRAKKIYDKYNHHGSSADIINSICDERMAFLKSLHTWSIFGKGWTTRVNSVRKNALQLAAGKSKAVPGHITAGGAIIAAGAAATVAYPNLWIIIPVTAIVIAIVVSLVIYLYKKRKTK